MIDLGTQVAPGPVLSMNDRRHHQATARAVRDWREAAYWWYLAACPGRGPAARAVGPAAVQVALSFPTARRRDPSNFQPTVKALVDGLVLAGAWPDDTPDHVEQCTPTVSTRVAQPAGPVLVRIVITPRKDP